MKLLCELQLLGSGGQATILRSRTIFKKIFSHQLITICKTFDDFFFKPCTFTIFLILFWNQYRKTSNNNSSVDSNSFSFHSYIVAGCKHIALSHFGFAGSACFFVIVDLASLSGLRLWLRGFGFSALVSWFRFRSFGFAALALRFQPFGLRLRGSGIAASTS